MVAALIAIWEFLVALGPLLSAIGSAIVGVVAALWEVTKITAVITLITVAIELLFDPKGKQRVGNLLYNLTAGALGVAQTLLTELSPEIEQVVKAFAQSFQNISPTMRDSVAGPIGDLVKNNFATASSNLTLGGESFPGNAVDQASAAFKQAYGFGISSAAITAAFEACFPEKLNVLNAMGPAFAGMAGFEEISKHALDPLYENAFGQGLKYLYKSLFKPEYADEADAVQWHSRRLLSDDDLKEVFSVSGLKAKYEPAFVASAYRSVQPRAIVNLVQDVDFPEAQMTDLMEFAGLRSADIDLMLPLMKLNSTKNVRQQYLSALERSVELGTETMANLVQAMQSMGYSTDAQTWVQLTVSERKLEQLAQLYRKSVSESYKYGTITDAQYVPALEAIGIDQADAEAHYAIDSIAKNGKIAAAAVRAAERLAAAQQRAATRSALSDYQIGLIDSVALEAALLAAGVDPTIATYAVNVAVAKRDGSQVLVYGLELPKHQALLLREKVAALKEQAIKKLTDPPFWLATLASLGIPDANAQALASEWQAQANKQVLPI